MHRFFLSPEQCRGAELVLRDAEAHHAAHVIRVRVGERVIVLDGVGGEYLCEVKRLSNAQAHLVVAQRNRIPPLPYRLTLIQAMTKGKAMDTIVQKATELGAARLVSIVSERTVSQPDEEGAGHKVARWRGAAVEACKQCGSAWLPQIDPPQKLTAFLAKTERFDLTLLATLQADARHPREHVEAYLAERKTLPEEVAVWVGPEGDFTPAEINLIRATGAWPITLGQLVLRSETAAIYCLSVLNYELQARRNAR
jgi:16S rRNA (uracil1498-N3)-methyltransferase